MALMVSRGNKCSRRQEEIALARESGADRMANGSKGRTPPGPTTEASFSEIVVLMRAAK